MSNFRGGGSRTADLPRANSRPAANYRGGRGGRGGRTGYRNGGRDSSDGHTRVLRGLFADGIWRCDCQPRLPAQHFKVKKEGKNQGRWFHTCQQKQTSDTGCGFFLWDEDAKPREEAAVLSGQRSEPVAGRGSDTTGNQMQARSNNPVHAGHGDAGFEAPIRPQQHGASGASATKTPPQQPSRKPMQPEGKKRSSAAAFDQDEGFFDRSFDSDDADELIKLADSISPQTPAKAQKTTAYATPATTTEKKKRILPWERETPAMPAMPMTPATQGKTIHAYFDTPSKPPAPLRQPGSSVANGGASPSTLEDISNVDVNAGATKEPVTPQKQPGTGPLATAQTPVSGPRYKDALSNPSDATSSLTAEVLAELSSVAIPSETLAKVRSILTKHDLKTQGLQMGRDVSWKALKTKDAKILELQAKVTSIEAERQLNVIK